MRTFILVSNDTLKRSKVFSKLRGQFPWFYRPCMVPVDGCSTLAIYIFGGRCWSARRLLSRHRAPMDLDAAARRSYTEQVTGDTTIPLNRALSPVAAEQPRPFDLCLIRRVGNEIQEKNRTENEGSRNIHMFLEAPIREQANTTRKHTPDAFLIGCSQSARHILLLGQCRPRQSLGT